MPIDLGFPIFEVSYQNNNDFLTIDGISKPFGYHLENNSNVNGYVGVAYMSQIDKNKVPPAWSIQLMCHFFPLNLYRKVNCTDHIQPENIDHQNPELKIVVVFVC